MLSSSRARDHKGRTITLLLLACSSLFSPASAVYITFSNCLDSSIVKSNPRHLQFVPYWVDADFDSSSPVKHLKITVYGNVTGQAVEGTYPPYNSPTWTNPNDTFGKIVDIDPSTNKYTTLFERYEFLNYNAATAPASEFCDAIVSGDCPLGPSFNTSIYDQHSLSAFSVAQDFNSSYAFATMSAVLTVKSGADGAPELACVIANITPSLGSRVSNLLRYLPVAVLIFVGIATAAAAIFSPWGTSDPFKWTTNFGRDQDLLRLVTPGFNDCLQYIQFAFLTACLSLSYPGFYQPAASRIGWSSLVFNESFVHGGREHDVLFDGMYTVNATYGMTRMSQLIGVKLPTDLFASMAVWLAVLCGAAILFCQLAFCFRWLYFKISQNAEEDLQQKNWPLTGGMLVRVVLNYFLFPIITFTTFQFLIASQAKFYMPLVAALVLAGIFLLAGWILFVLARTKPRSQLFDDLPTLLLYGSLYNTYNDERALFAVVPTGLAFLRGVTIGAIQPSGIAQIIILAICEVLFLFGLHAAKPFSSPTHMNIMHTVFSSIRLIIVILMVAFVPSLDVNEAAKGWIGYIILFVHGLVLVLGFFLNAIQTIAEVIARMAGAGDDAKHGAKRGALISYGWRQLRNRPARPSLPRPNSMASEAVMLNGDAESKVFDPESRARSMSASSRLLLANKRESNLSTTEPQSPGVDSLLGSSPGPGLAGLGGKRRLSQLDPYYRPPRARRATLEAQSNASGGKRASTKSNGEWGNSDGDWENIDPAGESSGARDTLSPPFFRQQRPGSDIDLGEAGPRTDYAVREVDFYYGVTRGPALSSQPTRKRKTGPADPMGPVSNATTWFQRFIGGKKKDKGKGFEVVRSSRAPPQMDRHNDTEEGQELQTSPAQTRFPSYHDNDETGPAVTDAEPGIPEAPKTKRRMPLDGPWDVSDSEEEQEEQAALVDRPASPPYVLDPISRGPSLRVAFPEDGAFTSSERPPALPNVPRKSSKRHSRGPSSEIPMLQANTTQGRQHLAGSKFVEEHESPQTALMQAPGERRFDLD